MTCFPPAARLLALCLALAPIQTALAQDRPAAGAAVESVDEVTASLTVGPGDVLRLRVFEWRPDLGEARTWDAFDGEFLVDARGRLSLPLIGAVEVAGRDLEEVGTGIGERLQRATGLLAPPSAVLDVVQWRPIYVTGAVSQPGEYPFRPGLSVLQAVSLAGGMRRGPDALSRFERDAISGRGELRVIALQLDQLAARRARLEAELADAEEIDFPEALDRRAQTEPAVARLLREEELIRRSRLESLEQEVAANEALQAMLEEQLEQLEQQAALKDSQITSIREETERVASLVERGLATATRLSELELRVAGFESDRGDITRSLIRAQVDINQAERNIISLRADLRRDIAREIRTTQGQIEEMNERFATASAMVNEAEVIAPAKSAAAERRSMFEPTYSIVRIVNGETQEIAADERTPIRPGDTVRAVVPLPDIGTALEDVPTASLPSGGPASLAARPSADGAR